MIQVNVLMKKIRRGLLVNIRYIWKVCWIKISVLFSIIGVVGSFISIPEYISYKISVVVLLLLITLCFGVSILGFIEKKTLLIFTTGNGKNVFVGVTDYSIKLAKKGNSITWIDTDLTAAFMDYMSLKFGKQYDQDFNNYYNIKIEL